MKNKQLKETLGITVIGAIIVLMALVPQIGFIKIPFLAFDFTLLFIPVIVGATLYGKKGGAILGLVFGLSSLFVAYTRPATPFDITFQNPLVSVMPRVIFPLVYLFLLDIAKKMEAFKISIIFNIILVLTIISFVFQDMNIAFTIFAMILLAISIAFSVYTFKRKDKQLLYVLPTFISVAVHGLLVLSMIALFYSEVFGKIDSSASLVYLIAIILITNTIVEAMLSSVVVQLILPTIVKVRKENF